MSKINLNLIDSRCALNGIVDLQIGQRCIAALSSEPETIEELELALQRFQPLSPELLSRFESGCISDSEAFESDLLIIDLSSRTVASNYSRQKSYGEVLCLDSENVEPLQIPYLLADDWLLTDSIEEYEKLKDQRQRERALRPRVNTRAILYGFPLLEFLAVNASAATNALKSAQRSPGVCLADLDRVTCLITEIHKRWLTTIRADLLGRSPREVMLSKRKAIDSDMESRMLQWTLQLQGPPCLNSDSAAYRFAGFGTHEWIVYYALVEYLLSKAFYYNLKLSDTDALRLPRRASLFPVEDLGCLRSDSASSAEVEDLIDYLEQLKLQWLTEPNSELEGRVPFFIIDNERKRLPEATSRGKLFIDEQCPACQKFNAQADGSGDITFWRLDPGDMNREFVFSTILDFTEWQTERRACSSSLEWVQSESEFPEQARTGETLMRINVSSSTEFETLTLDPEIEPSES